MFGYVRVSKPELKIKEYDMYKAVYCSLCKYTGKEYGIFTRFILNYDFVFAALLKLSLEDGFDGVKKGRCVCNPLKKCNYCKSLSEFDYPSAAALIMLKYKLNDDIEDEKGLKKAAARFLSLLFRPAFKKAGNRYPETEKTAREYFEDQKKSESLFSGSLDTVSAPTSRFLSAVLPELSEDEREKRVLSELGNHIGRFIYIADAYNDLEEDIKKGSFNPFSSLSKDAALTRAKEQCYLSINSAISAFELLSIKKFKDILGNIIYVGLEDVLLYITDKKGKINTSKKQMKGEI